MTTREFYNQVMNGGQVTAEMQEFATEALSKMDAQTETRRAKAAEKQAEKAPIRDALLEVMGDAENPKTATMLIAEAGLDIKPNSVPSLLRPLVDAGVVLKVDIKVTGKGTQRGYVRA